MLFGDKNGQQKWMPCFYDLKLKKNIKIHVAFHSFSTPYYLIPLEFYFLFIIFKFKCSNFRIHSISNVEQKHLNLIRCTLQL